MGTGYCGDNGKLVEVSYGREIWGSVSFSEHRIEGQGERYVRNRPRNRPMPRMVPMEQPVGSNRTMSFQRPQLVIYWCCSVLFEWCFLVLRTKQRQMGVQVPETTKQNSKKFTGRRFRPELPAVSANHRPRFPPLGYFPENGARGQGSCVLQGDQGPFPPFIYGSTTVGWGGLQSSLLGVGDDGMGP